MDTVSISTQSKATHRFNTLLPRTIDNIFVNNHNEVTEPIRIYCSQLNTTLSNNNGSGVSPLIIIHKKGFSKFNNQIPLGDIQNFDIKIEPSQELPIDFSIQFI